MKGQRTNFAEPVAILGVGWLGLPLAHALHAAGHQVVLSVRSLEKAQCLKQQGWQACVLQLAKVMADEWPLVAKRLVICVPPSKVDDYPVALARVCERAKAHGTEQLLFISASSVWGPGQQEYEVAQPQEARGLRILQAEQVVLTSGIAKVMILRPAGLYGPFRHPGRFLAGKVTTGEQSAVNLVHLDDVVAASLLLLARGKHGDCYTLTGPVHPTRGQFYSFAARSLALPVPIFTEPKGEYAPLTGQRICRELGFVYRWPDANYWCAQQHSVTN